MKKSWLREGEGHGVGVCQRGMIAMSKEGHTFRALLSHYLPQTRATDGRSDAA